jgi:hypothetical protein
MTFSFVRHPFDRLVSAYLDKIDGKKDDHYRSRAKKIHAIYGEVTFETFIR